MTRNAIIIHMLLLLLLLHQVIIIMEEVEEEEAVVVARVPFHPVVTEAIHRVVAVEVAARAQPALVVVGVEEEGGKNQ